MKLLSFVSLFALGAMAAPGIINPSAVQANNINNTALAFKADSAHHADASPAVTTEVDHNPDCDLDCGWGGSYCSRFPKLYHCNEDGQVRFIMFDLICALRCNSHSTDVCWEDVYMDKQVAWASDITGNSPSNPARLKGKMEMGFWT
ncbi:hypothetical protein SODALDRAFT_357320 [Sodiomyces alkalinus F11]|uniref:Uncharacterized protein n=1 Tax=Sodiomyces alkalinus (strain CBS 110278 / VKM F-3762 / F11) TaxID=1314773 RepID=A0A3N2Q3E2_SODAK|nr:hypothetical protein SODALDRAFT_357320 [Sodiomyces alkalinus F11]ROT41284.1 hypothetical protein SODALDRAFT_357320 [Sodiomyces alkalinus F11]